MTISSSTQLKITQRYAQISDRKLFRFVWNVKTVCCGIWFCGVVITRICKHVSQRPGENVGSCLEIKTHCMPIYISSVLEFHSGRVDTSMCSVVSGSLYQCGAWILWERERKVHKRPNDENIASTFVTCSSFTLSAVAVTGAIAGADGTVAVCLCLCYAMAEQLPFFPFDLFESSHRVLSVAHLTNSVVFPNQLYEQLYVLSSLIANV